MTQDDSRQYAPATQRNREPILAVLREILPKQGLVLEVASGSGEHAVHFAAAFANLTFQPSDPDPAALASIDAWGRESALPNLRPAIRLDATLARLLDMVRVWMLVRRSRGVPALFPFLLLAGHATSSSC